MTLEDELRNALQNKAHSIEPSEDSFARLSARVDSEQPATARRFGDRGRFLAVAAALVVVLGGIGIFATGTGDDQGTVAANPGGVEAVDQTTAPVPDGSGEPRVEATEARALRGFIAGPVRSTREEAAAAFLTLVGIEAAELVVVENSVDVYTANEDGSVGPVVSTLTLARVESSDGYSVAEATTGSVRIDSPVPPEGSGYSRFVANDVTIAGSGTGFEATIGVEVISSIDGTLLDNAGVSAGNFGELEPFSDTVQVYGEGRAWIVIRSLGGADNMTEPFAAVPISYDTPLHPTVYTVVDVADDDPDGGLNVRNLPGVTDASAPDEAEVSDASVSDEAEVSDASVSDGAEVSDASVSDGAEVSDASVSDGAEVSDASVSDGAEVSDASVSDGAEVSDASVSDGAEVSDASVSEDPAGVVGVLAPGTTDIHIRSLVPATIGSEIWWNIEVGDIEGWVNSRYLTDVVVEDDAVDTAELEQIALNFDSVMAAGGVGIETLPWPTSGVVRVGYVHNLLEVSTPTVATADYWASDREILSEGMAGQDGLVTSLAEFVKPFPDAPIEVSFDADSPYPLDQEVLDEFDQALDVVTIGYATDEYAFHNIHLYLEGSADGPVIVAVAVVIWVP